MCQGLNILQAMGVGLGRSHRLALLAEGYGRSGQVDDGLATVTEALDLVNTTRERFHEAEVWRIKGELRLAQTGERQIEPLSHCRWVDGLMKQ